MTAASGTTGSLAGRLLLAVPGMAAPFTRSAIAMCSHDADGALGIDLATPLPDVRLSDIFGQFGLTAPADLPVLCGGPVEPQRGFLLHSPDYAGPATLRVGDSFALTASLSIVEDIAAGRGPSRWRFALGYAGWGPGQLEGELTRHGWMIGEAPARALYATAAQSVWADGYAGIGVDPALLAQTIGHG